MYDMNTATSLLKMSIKLMSNSIISLKLKILIFKLLQNYFMTPWVYCGRKKFNARNSSIIYSIF